MKLMLMFSIDELHGVLPCFAIRPLLDYHSSTPLQKNLCHMVSKNTCRRRHRKVKERIMDWLSEWAANFCGGGGPQFCTACG
jgi:hypothetical protein